MCRTDYVCPLSRCQLRALEAVAREGSYKAAATALGLSDQTVKNHASNIIRRLGLWSVTTAAVYAVERGWIREVTTGAGDAG